MSPIIGKVIAECSTAGSETPFLFVASGLDEEPCALRLTVSDFNSNTFHVSKSQLDLEDLRDDIGIGGSWSEFVDYTVASLGSSDVKLILDGSSGSGGASRAKLIAQKAKGMPRISIPLSKLVDGAAGEAMANLSLELYKDYRDVKSSLAKEQLSNHQLTKAVADEKEKSDSLQKHLDTFLYSRKGKFQRINGTDNLDSTSVNASQDSPVKQAAKSPGPPKANRVVPAFRRSKVRGAILQDTEDD